MDSLLSEIESANPSDVEKLLEKFPRGSIGMIIESHPELLPKGIF